MGSGLTVGYVVWTIRGGLLVSSLLAQMPAWRLIDPLVVLQYVDDYDGDDEDDSLQSIVNREHTSDSDEREATQ